MSTPNKLTESAQKAKFREHLKAKKQKQVALAPTEITDAEDVAMIMTLAEELLKHDTIKDLLQDFDIDVIMNSLSEAVQVIAEDEDEDAADTDTHMTDDPPKDDDGDDDDDDAARKEPDKKSANQALDNIFSRADANVSTKAATVKQGQTTPAADPAADPAVDQDESPLRNKGRRGRPAAAAGKTAAAIRRERKKRGAITKPERRSPRIAAAQ